jgi:hypothetical protein
MQLFSADAAIFREKKFDSENMKKPPPKVVYNRPTFFFSVLPTRPKSAQISYIFHKNCSLRNSYIMTLDQMLKSMMDFFVASCLCWPPTQRYR